MTIDKMLYRASQPFEIDGTDQQKRKRDGCIQAIIAAQDRHFRLPPVSIRALQRQLADLEPTITESGESRSTRG